MRTEVKLNSVYYKLKQLPSQTLANQMASKVGQGTSEYGDLTTWSAWIQEDWQDGVGKVNPHLNGGFLYGEAESRVPGQLILPQLMRQVDTRDIDGTTVDCRYMPETVTGVVEVGGAGNTIQRIGIKFTTPASPSPYTSSEMWIYARIPAGVDLTFAIYTDSSGPNTLVDSGNLTNMENTKGFYWHRPDENSLTTSGLSNSTAYWLVVYPQDSSESFEIGYGTSGYDAVGKSYNGSVWADITGKYLIYTSQFYPMATTNIMHGGGFFRFNDTLYLIANKRVWKYDTTNDEWDDVGAITGVTNVSSFVPFDDLVYIGNWPDSAGAGDKDYYTMTTGEVITDTGIDGTLFARDMHGHLWKAIDNTVEYSEDGSTWEPTTSYGAAITVSDPEYPILAMCQMGENMYCATAQGLICIYPGDIARSVVPWGGVETRYDRKRITMVNFEGALYIAVNGRLQRYTEDGSLQDVWVAGDEDIIQQRIGRVWGLAVSNNWLFAYVADGEADARKMPTVWAYQNNNWHAIATLPLGDDLGANEYGIAHIYYDRPTSKLWVATFTHLTYNIYVPDLAMNPYNDPDSVYAHSAWVEWDWFHSPILEAQKDYDSVTIIGENITAARWVEVYWQDDDSTGWELLGVCNDNSEELRWTLGGGLRPNTTRFRLAFLIISTQNATETPKIHGFRVKYHLMVRDWFRWNVVIDVSGRSGAFQMLADGTRNNLTAGQIKDNLDALCKQVPPFVYQDVDGNLWEVKVTDANFQYTKYEYNENTTNEWWEGVYNLVLEAVTASEYTP